MDLLAPDPVVLLVALLLDLSLGDPPNRWHPVAWLGQAVAPWSKPREDRPWLDGLRGLGLVLASVLLFAGGGSLVVVGLSAWPFASFVVGVFLLKSSFAIQGLGAAAKTTVSALRAGDLSRARWSLRSLCSRDPSQLNEEQVCAAVVESVAENASDSAVAP